MLISETDNRKQLMKEQEYLNHHIRNGIQSIEGLMKQIDHRLSIMNEAITIFKERWKCEE